MPTRRGTEFLRPTPDPPHTNGTEPELLAPEAKTDAGPSQTEVPLGAGSEFLPPVTPDAQHTDGGEPELLIPEAAPAAGPSQTKVLLGSGSEFLRPVDPEAPHSDGGEPELLMPEAETDAAPRRTLGAGREFLRPVDPEAPHTDGREPKLLLRKHISQTMVIEYLKKKGFDRTEAMFRREAASSDADGRPIHGRVEEGGAKYSRAFNLLRTWINDNLEIYKAELRKLLWPIFVHCVLTLASGYHAKECGTFFDTYSEMFMPKYEEDLRALATVRLPEHVEGNAIAKLYRKEKYRLTLSTTAYFNLIQFLEAKERDGGAVITSIIQSSMYIVTVDRASAGNERSLATMLARGRMDEDLPDEDEGIPGHNPGSANTDPKTTTLVRLSLGPLPMDPDFSADVRAHLEEEDSKNPPTPGLNSLVEEFEQRIKRESSDNSPSRDNIPLPPALSRDLALEIQRVKENRERFKIEGKTGGVGPGVSVIMYTFHNTFDSITCIDFSRDEELVAVGTSESYIRVWSLTGKALPNPSGTSTQPFSSHRLIGHSGPVYAVAFSPSTAMEQAVSSTPTHSNVLLSSSADCSIRLWSLETWACLVVYKAHKAPVWDVTWGPFGHYFVSGSSDHTARLWSTNHVSPLRIFAGHEMDVDHVCFHPNNSYVFTASCDKTVRMWDVGRGSCVRIFTGHTSNITAVACAPNGKTVASADDVGSIFLWDLASGRRMKRMRGHGKGGIWSLSWSIESAVLVSGGADGTVRVWDVTLPTSEGGQQGTMQNGKVIGEGGAGVKIDGGMGAGAAKKGKAKEVVVTGDQISAFPTKKSPVYKVQFTQMNLVLAGSAYMP